MAGAQEKTEKATGKKLSDARKRGKIAKSRELNAVTGLLGGGLAVYFSSRLLYDQFRQLLAELWGQGFSTALQSPPGAGIMPAVVYHFFLMLMPTLLTASVMALGINLMQTKGLLFSSEAMRFDLSRLNPMQGFQRLLSVRSLIELAKSILKMLIVAYAVYSVFRSDNSLFVPLVGQEVGEIARTFGHLTFKILIRVCGIMLVLSLLDYYYQRWQYQKDLMMTKQEVKEEHKQTEGNPQIKSRIRSIQRTLARQRMMASVPKASVVITNPTHYAVALLYDPQMEAPKVLAKGMSFLAKKIIKVARKHRIPVVQNPPLARALYKEVKVDETIPASLYKAVAKVLAYIYQQKRTKPT